MSANETNINKLYSEFYYYNQPVINSFNIEYIMLVTHIIHTIESLFYVCKASPFAFLDMVVHSCKATFASGYVSAYSFIACSVNILIRFTQLSYCKSKTKFCFSKLNSIIYNRKNSDTSKDAAIQLVNILVS